MFSSNYDENDTNLPKHNDYNSYDTNQNNSFFDTRFNYKGIDTYDRDNKYYSPDTFGFFSRDPIIDEFERIVNNIQSTFHRGGFLDDEFDKHFTGGHHQYGFPFDFNNSYQHNEDNEDNDDYFFNNNHHKSNLNNKHPFPPNHFENRGKFDNINKYSQENQITNRYKEPAKTIRYYDSKIYDV